MVLYKLRRKHLDNDSQRYGTLYVFSIYIDLLKIVEYRLSKSTMFFHRETMVWFFEVENINYAKIYIIVRPLHLYTIITMYSY